MYFFISYTSNALMHEGSWASIFTDSTQNEPVHQNTVTLGLVSGGGGGGGGGGPLLAPGYGLQAKAESTNCFIIYTKCFRFQNMLTSVDIKFLSLFFCSSACKEMFCVIDILKIGVITYRMVFW